MLKDRFCQNCGTDLAWWVEQSKRNKVYRIPSDDLFCTKQCAYEYIKPSVKELYDVERIA